MGPLRSLTAASLGCKTLQIVKRFMPASRAIMEGRWWLATPNLQRQSQAKRPVSRDQIDSFSRPAVSSFWAAAFCASGCLLCLYLLCQAMAMSTHQPSRLRMHCGLLTGQKFASAQTLMTRLHSTWFASGLQQTFLYSTSC